MGRNTKIGTESAAQNTTRWKTPEIVVIGTVLGALQLVAAVLQLFSDWNDRLRIALFFASVVGLLATWRLVRTLREKRRRTWLAIVAVPVACSLLAAGVVLARSDGSGTRPTIQLSARVVRNEDATSSRPHGLTNGADVWSQNVTASVGDTVEWRLAIQSQAPSEDLSVLVYFPAEVSPVADQSIGTLRGRTLSFKRQALSTAKASHVMLKATVGDIPYCPRSSFLLAIVKDGPGHESTAISPLTSFNSSCDDIEGAGRWYPGDRQSWDWDVDKQGPTQYPVLNSYFNTPYYGDERAFLDSAPFADADRPNSFKDVTPVSAFGDRVIVRMYVINDANKNIEPPLIARGTRVRLKIPSGRETSLRVRGYISATNAVPPLVEDTADFVSDTAFRLTYVPGSARAYSAQFPKGGLRLSDDIVGPDGAIVGSQKLNGDLLPDFDAQMSVEVELNVIPG